LLSKGVARRSRAQRSQPKHSALLLRRAASRSKAFGGTASRHRSRPRCVFLLFPPLLSTGTVRRWYAHSQLKHNVLLLKRAAPRSKAFGSATSRQPTPRFPALPAPLLAPPDGALLLSKGVAQRSHAQRSQPKHTARRRAQRRLAARPLSTALCHAAFSRSSRPALLLAPPDGAPLLSKGVVGTLRVPPQTMRALTAETVPHIRTRPLKPRHARARRQARQPEAHDTWVST
jgi:hypothetical protein